MFIISIIAIIWKTCIWEKKLWQEKNKILDNTHHEKVIEVEKLNTTMAKLEEEVLASGAIINVAWDYH